MIQYQGNELKRERKAVVVERELDRIYQKRRVVTVDVVLGDARNPKSPLHSYFEWDDAVAGERYRRAQATAMIMASKYVAQLVENEKKAGKGKTVDAARVRRLVNAFRGEGFKLRTDVLKDQETRDALIEKKRAVLRSWCDSVIDIQELTPIREAILKVL
jgi:hypothetical protein